MSNFLFTEIESREQAFHVKLSGADTEEAPTINSFEQIKGM